MKWDDMIHRQKNALNIYKFYAISLQGFSSLSNKYYYLSSHRPVLWDFSFR